MDLFQGYAQGVLANAGIWINGERPYDIRVHDPRVFREAFLGGNLALGNAYMDKRWDCADLTGFFTRMIRAGSAVHHPSVTRLLLRVQNKIGVLQDLRRARVVGEKHYDIGNDLYEAMLDPRMVYTCGYWPKAATLAEAQEHKLDLICRKINLQPGQRVLDIGCGWGSFAQFAAERYGAEVHGVTISKEQLALGKERCAGLNVHLYDMDYRLMPREFGPMFDHIVSIGMFEHVGPAFYRVYMQAAHACLKDGPENLFLLHTIGGNGADPWINRHIFPGGVLPTMAQIDTAVRDLFVTEDVHNFGHDYAPTLRAWHDNFTAAWPELEASGRYDERFKRMWDYYLSMSEAGFRARETQLWQIVLSKKGVPGGYTSVR